MSQDQKLNESRAANIEKIRKIARGQEKLGQSFCDVARMHSHLALEIQQMYPHREHRHLVRKEERLAAMYMKLSESKSTCARINLRTADALEFSFSLDRQNAFVKDTESASEFFEVMGLAGAVAHTPRAVRRSFCEVQRQLQAQPQPQPRIQERHQSQDSGPWCDAQPLGNDRPAKVVTFEDSTTATTPSDDEPKVLEDTITVTPVEVLSPSLVRRSIQRISRCLHFTSRCSSRSMKER